MNREYKFKPVILTKLFWRLAVIGIITSLVIFTTFNIDIAFRYMFSMLIIFAGLLFVFYINRNEPEYINIEKDTIKITYFNKAFFKRKPGSFSIEELSNKSNNDEIISLNKDSLMIVNLRKESLESIKWEELKKLFTKSN
jgi:hypothetical protein